MNLPTTDLFQLASQRLQWLSDKQRVTSENIANADTAGYRAREVESFDQYLEKAAFSDVLQTADVAETESTWGETLSGNNVVIEEQILQATETAGKYRVASSLYRKAHEMLMAVSSGR